MSGNSSDKASRLFQFLADLQSLKETPIRKVSEYTEKGGTVVTFQKLLEDIQTSTLKVSVARQLEEVFGSQATPLKDPAPSDLIFEFYRPTVGEFPALPSDLEDHFVGDVENPFKTPTLRSPVGENSSSESDRSRAEKWLAQREAWATAARAMEVYRTLFDIQTKTNQQSDEFELVFGLGKLHWDDGLSVQVDRHLFTVPLAIAMDKVKGSISVSLGEQASLRAELEAVPLDHLEDGRFIEDLRLRVSEFEGDPLSREESADLGKYAANGLATAAEYVDMLTVPAAGKKPMIAWAPALILRPRRMVGLANTFRSIAEDIGSGNEVPEGLRPLVDPNFSPELESSSAPGALTNVGGELFSPLPLNDKQQRVLERVDSHAHTIVQGPPGTGKTHMAAALLSHLLAQGKRVLVTAETERALYELRDKLPAEIQELAVSVVGSSTSEMAELRTAISTIQSKSSAFDAKDSAEAISPLRYDLDKLHEERTRSLREWASKLERAQQQVSVEGYSLPLPQAVEKVQAEKDRYGWIDTVRIEDLEAPFPLSADEVRRINELISNSEVRRRLDYSGDNVLSPDNLVPTPKFAAAVDALASTEKAVQELSAALPRRLESTWKRLNPEQREDARTAVLSYDLEIRKLGLAEGPWSREYGENSSDQDIAGAMEKASALSEKVAALATIVREMDGLQRINVDCDPDEFVPIARSLRGYLAAGNKITVRPDGSVKMGLFTSSVVKLAGPFFESVRVNGMPPVTVEAIDFYLSLVEFEWGLSALREEWPHVDSDTTNPREALRRLQADLESFTSYMQTLSSIKANRSMLRERNLATSSEEAHTLADAVPALEKYTDAQVQHEQAKTEYERIAHSLNELGYSGVLHPWIRRYQEAVRDRNVSLYQEALTEGQVFHQTGLIAQELAGYLSRIRVWSAELADKLMQPTETGEWVASLYEAEGARNWCRARNEVSIRVDEGEADPLAEIHRIDKEIHDKVATLAAQRAWNAAVGSERINGEMRETMVAYAQAVKRLGKGTGKYAEKHRRDVRKHLRRARGAVPVWIMPIYKVVEQFELEQNMFDVVIVDEASQAGVEAIFLQYLAPRIVVIGDDHQVSPSAVGQSREQLQGIARQYLYDFANVDAWIDPERSLFDDANMRYGGRIALDEHRRCVPEIIEFSNELTYRPNNIELKPVRMVEADRLAPFRITHTPNAFMTGTKGANKVEADALVSRLIEALDDPRYDGKTFGVISLLSSSSQESYIKSRLLDALPPSAWADRDLKVGKPADFQGAERDVIFLSMVTPSPQGQRLSSLTREMYIQRYNVAVSRAKDQVWLFHSVGKEELANHDDVRFKLLEYAYRVAQARPELNRSAPVPPDERVEPFDSLFEQRVYNDLVLRGYYVIPQFDTYGRRIDLVVQGRNSRVAVECDGDYWHSEEYAIQDQSRQRELERLGWKFVRVFESDYYLDRNEQIERIILKLEQEGITPWTAEDSAGDVIENVEVIESFTEISGAPAR